MPRFTAAVAVPVVVLATFGCGVDEPSTIRSISGGTPTPVAVSASPDVTVVGADITQRAALDEALARFRANQLELPDLEVRFSDDPTDCYGHLGGFQQGLAPWRVLVCSELDFVITHELAHAWAAANLDDNDQKRYIAARGLTNWDDDDAPWNERGTEDAAFIIQQNLMATNPLLTSPTWVERTEAYTLLTGAPSPLRQSRVASTAGPRAAAVAASGEFTVLRQRCLVVVRG